MKRFTILTLALLTVISTASVYAQRGEGQGGQGRGMMGRFGGPDTGETIADALVLDAERAEKVAAVAETSRRSAMADMRGEGRNFREMSAEERREAFQAMMDKTNAALAEDLKEVLSDGELEAVQPLLGVRFMRTDPQVRALRLIDIDDETRLALRPHTLGYLTAMAEVQSSADPAAMRERMRGGEEALSEEARETIRKARESMIAGVKETLNDDQEAAWEVKAEEVREEMREDRPGGRRGGEGRRSGAGQGRQRG